MQSVQDIFDRYQSVRSRLPEATFAQCTKTIGSLMDIADEVDAYVFDAFGVLNVGETPIPGAAARLDMLRARGCAIRVLSNAASYNHQGAVAKFQNLGINVTSDEIITSRDATLADLDNRTWGCISATADDLSDIPSKTLRLGDDPSLYAQADGFLFLSSTGWSPSRQALLSKALKARPRPVVIANADLAAPRETGFSQEPGYFGHLLVDQAEGGVRFFGKPFGEVYALAEAGLGGIAPSRIAMVGDTLHTDIIGGAARGWRTVLVTQDGMFAGHDVRHFCHASGINPDWCVKRI
ncbi:HAD-IIA family hydrolase [Thalassorhabdomicrobium marinisediminis]|uniref:Haloacid dehalogenase n=1 Tax=Thalassorhabdomicrobium marinisediminis TaxID=2170577 RepID=A0A2T7FU63_9RHOB|nr:HAD family hydrolase [Thalassorhabdomicrobium marinisediminis]PVA05705.1 haloacid dehalogenase [Thalassorhabdomicrobium marinisediminis]